MHLMLILLFASNSKFSICNIVLKKFSKPPRSS